jgi:sialidase-1
MRHASLAAAMLSLVLLAETAPAQQRLTTLPNPRSDLEQRGDEYPVFRIPALAVTTHGTLLAAYDGRPTMADLPSHISVLVRRSTDNGRTWLPRAVVRADTAPAGFGDPSLIVDRATGRIFLFYAASMRQGFFGSATGNREDDPEVLQADYSWSDDDGVTWQHRRITGMIKQPAWGGIFASSGAGIQLEHGPHAGRLLQQYVVRFQGANYGASAYSDDHGRSWRMGGLVGPGVDENKVVELADGRLMLNSRAKPARKVALSTDGGESWHELHADPALVDPGNNGAIIRVDARAPASTPAAHWLLFSNTADSTRRLNLTVKLSCDDGRSWPFQRVIEPGAAAYSTLAVLPDGTIGLLY